MQYIWGTAPTSSIEYVYIQKNYFAGTRRTTWKKWKKWKNCEFYNLQIRFGVENWI